MNELKSKPMKDIDRIDETSRPVATGVGAVVGGAAGGIAGGAAAGAAVGGMTGPVGAAVGAVVGAVAGAMAGKGIANAIDPVAEDAYWRDNYSSRPYASGSDYDEYRPAYGYGVDAYTRYPAALSMTWRRNSGATGTAGVAARASTGTTPSTRRATPGSA